MAAKAIVPVRAFPQHSPLSGAWPPLGPVARGGLPRGVRTRGVPLVYPPGLRDLQWDSTAPLSERPMAAKAIGPVEAFPCIHRFRGHGPLLHGDADRRRFAHSGCPGDAGFPGGADAA